MEKAMTGLLRQEFDKVREKYRTNPLMLKESSMKFGKA